MRFATADVTDKTTLLGVGGRAMVVPGAATKIARLFIPFVKEVVSIFCFLISFKAFAISRITFSSSEDFSHVNKKSVLTRLLS